ncbi:DUF1963 domain-containing protein [Caldalkalibacillus mannanilyticus]|uniref:DUF1963 domain-containing protein n=1 Tax=Caldalkalibacillus mannanilyticus TaxID=1418 RepID=UPI000468AA8B|nr:DUF1963 domain-containing protein [Caldalkalibacillus mannanilyticus]
MIATKRIVPSTNQSVFNPVIYFGGNTAKVDRWPQNPDGDYLTLLFSINCTAFQKEISRDFPSDGVIHVFSTYSRQNYFLDYITYSGTPAEFKLITSGYTTVIHSEINTKEIKSPVASMPRLNMELVDDEITETEFSTASFISQSVPNGIVAADKLSAEYNFFCQVYSSDFPEPYQDALYLTDAIGYLFLRKGKSAGEAPGIFFVQTA